MYNIKQFNQLIQFLRNKKFHTGVSLPVSLEQLEAVSEEPLPSTAIGSLTPFRLQLGDQRAIIENRKERIIEKGIYLLAAGLRGGSSNLLLLFNGRFHPQEGNGYCANDYGQRMPISQMDSQQRNTLTRYVPAETLQSSLPPRILCARLIGDVIPRKLPDDANPVLKRFMLKHINNVALTPVERSALRLVTRYAMGDITEDAIKRFFKEERDLAIDLIHDSGMDKPELIMERLRSRFRRIGGDNPLFSQDTIEAILEAPSLDSLPTYVRAALRTAFAIEMKPPLLLIDKTLDVTKNYLPRLIELIEDHSTTNNAAVIVSTSNSTVERQLHRSKQHHSHIMIEKREQENAPTIFEVK